jgi:hypothetical protein
MKEPIVIRAHHLLCIPRFYRGGYDEEFADNMKKTCLTIRKDPGVRIRVVIGKPDVLCRKCPHRHGDRCMQSGEIERWVMAQDEKVAAHLGLEPGAICKAKDVFSVSMEMVSERAIRPVCEGCIFLDNCIRVGINNSFRKDIQRG